MPAKCTLSCKQMNQKITLNLSSHVQDLPSVDYSKCATVFEDGSYGIQFSCDLYSKSDLESAEFCVNGEHVGNLVLSPNSEIIEGYVQFKETNFSTQPFLLLYDLVTLSFNLFLNDGSSIELYSDYLLCVSKNPDDVANIDTMLKTLMTFDDSQIGEWIFSDVDHGGRAGLYEGGWSKRTYKSLYSYIQLLEQVVSCYKSNYVYFKMHGKHSIARSNVLVSYEKVKNVPRSSFDWITQNADQLAEVPYSSGIHYHGKNYLPYQISTDSNRKSWDVYENRVVNGFLYTVLLNAKQVYDEFDKDVLNEERIIARIHGRFPSEYRAPIITIKSLQVAFFRTQLVQLRRCIDVLESLYLRYSGLFDSSTLPLTAFPQKTRTFCEIKPYAQVFDIIVHWFRYGEYSLAKEKLLLQIKTLDKLFEYYCLIKLLNMFAFNGYKKAEIPNPVFNYDYTTSDSYYHNEKDVANTYVLTNGHVMLTLYYQPVISSVRFENNLTLYRARTPQSNKFGYYTPDFVLKFSTAEHPAEYVIFDSKFSRRENIIKYLLPEVMRKYSLELCVASDCKAPKMVWVLQGRIENAESLMWRYHNTRLSLQFPPVTSYGILSINTAVDTGQRLWNEIKRNVSFL